ncbi:MAG TPA: hypothetical protein VLK25_05185 [Allosphingosinicella sp.]|nr:hypothetical protein [Allosphingosinicella sp.]
MPCVRLFLSALLALSASSAFAQTIVASPRPDRVAVTVYRDPNRGAGDAFDLGWLNGFALISETRQVALPAGEAVIRFEGVAGGIIPQSAIVTGFPDGIVERNRDAYLLSPATLLDRSLGRRVHLRRTSHATGAVTEEEAVIMTGADGAVVLRTAAGYEALRCTGLPETIRYDGVPAELTPTPTLSVRARNAQPVTATVTLSYLATGFDWQANYIAQLAPDGRHADLFAWLTLASTDETSFPDAQTQAVAGNINYTEPQRQPREGGPLNLDCWPSATTSDIPLEELARMNRMVAPAPMVAQFGSSIVVTGTRVRRPNLESTSPITTITAEQEALGDLKLYRIPVPVTVAANGQKQIALLTQPRVRVEMVYRQRLYLASWEDAEREPEGVPLYLVTRNREADGLGLPLPAGTVALFAQGPDRPILLGEATMADRAVEEDVEVEFQASPLVRAEVRGLKASNRGRDYELIVTNARDRPVRFEAEFQDELRRFRPSRRVFERDGMRIWAATIPANGRTVFRFRVLRGPDQD